MALKALMLRKKIDLKKADLEKLRAKAADIQKREEEIEAAIAEITDESTEDERATVEAEADAMIAERGENDGAIADLEGEIEEMETELAGEEARQKKNPAAEPKKRGAQEGMQTREVTNMPARVTRFEDMNIMERHAFFENEEVRSFLDKVRSMRGNVRAAGSVNNDSVLIPEIALPMLMQIVEENSKLTKHVYGPTVPGKGRARIDGGFPEAVWTEMYGRLNELEIGYFDVEIDGFKLGGIVRIPNALLEDSDINLMGEILKKLGQGMGYSKDKAICYGTGTKMPLGFVTRLAQESQPANYPTTMRPWVDLHSTNIVTITLANSTGITLFQEIVKAFGNTKNAYSHGEKFWVMNEKTFNTLLAESMNINGAGMIYAGFGVGGKVMPVIGGAIETLDFVPDNVILAGYDNMYCMATRKDVQFAQSEHVFFVDDMTAFKGTARYDGLPLIAEAFVAIGINGVTPTDVMTFTADTANSVTGIILSNATVSVKATRTVQLTAQTLPVDATVTWTSSDTTKATVSSAGVVTGVAAGSATVTATCGTCTAVCTVTVTN